MFYAHHIGTFLTTYSKKQIAGDDRVKRLLNPRDVACNYNLSKTVCVQNVRNGEDGLLQDQKSFVKTLHANGSSLAMKKVRF